MVRRDFEFRRFGDLAAGIECDEFSSFDCVEVVTFEYDRLASNDGVASVLSVSSSSMVAPGCPVVIHDSMYGCIVYDNGVIGAYMNIEPMLCGMGCICITISWCW